jgi:hypothetical protein
MPLKAMDHRHADIEISSASPCGKSVTGEKPRSVASPTGTPLSLKDLPPAGTTRWVVRRKAEVVAGVRGGLISLEDALRRYNLTIDEFRSWQRLLENHGLEGLRVTRLKKYRKAAR